MFNIDDLVIVTNLNGGEFSAHYSKLIGNTYKVTSVYTDKPIDEAPSIELEGNYVCFVSELELVFSV